MGTDMLQQTVYAKVKLAAWLEIVQSACVQQLTDTSLGSQIDLFILLERKGKEINFPNICV